MKKNILFIFILLYSITYADGYDPLNGFSTSLTDFSSRSLILNSVNKTPINQEQKDILQSKKLVPTTACLVKQIKKGNIENVKLLLECKINPNGSYMGDYPIYIAAKYKKDEIVRLLYEYGAKLDRGFYSELYEATKNKNSDLAFFLINCGAKVNYQDSVTNNTILSRALENKMYDLAKVLIQNGARADNLSLKIVKKKKLNWLIEEAMAEKAN